jgi:hypothetical protein
MLDFIIADQAQQIEYETWRNDDNVVIRFVAITGVSRAGGIIIENPSSYRASNFTNFHLSSSRASEQHMYIEEEFLTA